MLHAAAIAAGAGVALAIAVPAAVVAQGLDESGSVEDNSSWLPVLFLIVIVGMVAGGYTAAVRRADAPLANGAVAALTAYLLVQGVGVIRLLASDESVTWAAIPFFALLSTAAGMTGGLLADARARRPR